MTKDLSNFDSNPLTCDPTSFPGKSRTNIAKSNPIFPGKGRRDETFFLTCLDSPMAEVFPHFFFFLFRPSSGGNGPSKLDPKC